VSGLVIGQKKLGAASSNTIASAENPDIEGVEDSVLMPTYNPTDAVYAISNDMPTNDDDLIKRQSYEEGAKPTNLPTLRKTNPATAGATAFPTDFVTTEPSPSVTAAHTYPTTPETNSLMPMVATMNPAVQFTNSPTDTCSVKSKDICGESSNLANTALMNIDKLIADLETDLDEGVLTQEEIHEKEEMLCSMKDMRVDLEESIHVACVEAPARLLQAESCYDEGFDLTDLVNSWFIAKGVLIVANQVLANAGLDPTGITTSIASGAVAAAELALLTFENSINDIVGARASCTLDIVENVRLTLNDIRETVDNIEETVDENRIFVEFLWCPYTQEQQDGTTLIGQGCDTMDNNCNSDILVNPQKKRVDECAEDQVPPTLTIRKEVPPVGFTSYEEARQFFEDNVEASDDCVSNLEVEISDILGGPRSFEITVRAFDPVCSVIGPPNYLEGEKLAAFETIRTFEFIIDGTGPTIKCGFDKRQDLFHVNDPEFEPDCATAPPFPSGGREDPLHITAESDLVDVEFWYQITDESQEEKKLSVKVSVLSNEYDLSDGSVMARLMERRSLPNGVHRAKVYLEPYSCRDGGSSICDVETTGNPELNARFYDIEVTSADELGNKGSATCSVIVIPQGSKSSKAGKSQHPGSSWPGVCASGKSAKKALGLFDHVVGTGKSGKTKPSIPHDPNDLRSEFALSTQRFRIETIGLEWDTSLDTKRADPEPLLLASKSSKSSVANGVNQNEAVVDDEDTPTIITAANIVNSAALKKSALFIGGLLYAFFYCFG